MLMKTTLIGKVFDKFDKILQSDPTRNETKPTTESLSTAALGTSRNLISLFETMQNGHPNDVRETMHLPTIGGIYTTFIYIYTPEKYPCPQKKGPFQKEGRLSSKYHFFRGLCWFLQECHVLFC